MSADKIIDYRELIAKSTAGFVGRRWVRDAVDSFLQATGPRHFLLLGEPGSGKTSFMADLVCRRGYPHHFIGKGSQIGLAASLDWRNPIRFAESLGYQLLRDYGGWIMDWKSWGISVRQEVKELQGLLIGAHIGQFKGALHPAGRPILTVKQEVAQFGLAAQIIGVYIEKFEMNIEQVVHQLLTTPLRKIARRWPEQQVVVIVDGLDEAGDYADTGSRILDFLPNGSLPANVRFLLSSRPDEYLTLGLLGQVRRFWLSEDEDGKRDPRTLEDAKDYVVQLAKKKSVKPMLTKRKIAPETLGQRVAAASQGNFLYLHHYARGLQNGDETLLDLEALPKGLYNIYAHFLGKIKAKRGGVSWDGAYKPVLGILAVARAPLTRQQVAAFSGVGPSTVGTILVRLQQFLGRQKDQQNRWLYTIYHKSFSEYLTSEENEDHIDGPEAHTRISAYCRGHSPTWSDVAWQQMDEYGLQHLVVHQYALREDGARKIEFHQLVQCEPFFRQRLQRWWNPQPVLDDLRQALELALDDDDLVLVWRHIQLYRRLVWDEQDFQRLLSAVQAGEYQAALERTRLYAYMPNSQALARLWIAWEAAAKGLQDIAQDAIHLALTSLSPHGAVPDQVTLVDDNAPYVVSDAVREALQRLLVRIARSVAPPDIEAQEDWLTVAARAWPAEDVQDVVNRLLQPLASWGDAFSAALTSTPITQLFKELGRELTSGDSPQNFRDVSWRYHRRLAAGLFNSRDQLEWPGYVQETVDRVSLDDYPSYREMALAWIAAAVLAHQDDGQSRSALSRVLSGAFKAPPGFWGDTAAAVLGRRAAAEQQPLLAGELRERLERLELQQQREPDPTVIHKPEDLIEWRLRVGLPPDPWSHRIRRCSAVAAVLYRREEYILAEDWLHGAAAAGHGESYAGYRALARLSLACRWLEWDNLPAAKRQLAAARKDACHMLDPVLREERLALITEMHSWVKSCSGDLADLDGALRRISGKVGLARAQYIEFLSAVWHADAFRLKRLVPLALEDATTTDAVLGRLLGCMASGKPADATFRTLEAAMHLEV